MTGFGTFGRLLAGVVCLAVFAPAAAQEGGKPAFEAPRATEYEEVTRLPDWTGIWYPDWSLLFGGRAAARPQLTPAAQAKLDEYNAKYKDTGPPLYAQAHCLPPGMPGMMQQPYPIEFLYSPGRVTLITEAYEQVRRIYTDGRPLPEDPDLFFKGNSVGHWDGDTLVVDSNGFSLLTSIAPGIEHSAKMSVRERIYLQAAGQLIDEISITDPEVLTEPFVTKVAFKLDNAFPIREYVCAENNRLTSDEGGANIDLKLDDADDPFATLDEQ